MSESRKGLGELGPAWITAIAALLVAATGFVGFVVGKVSTPQPGPAAVTKTVTVAPPGDHSSTAAESSSDTGVYWSGELVWGKHDLDARPPSGQAVWHDSEHGAALRTETGGVLKIWSGDSRTPDRDQCVTAVASGSSMVQGLTAPSYICGRTPAGRPFRIQVFGAGTAEISGHVTVWEK